MTPTDCRRTRPAAAAAPQTIVLRRLYDKLLRLTLYNNSSAVAEMGDRLAHNRHYPKSEEDVVPLSVGELGPHLTQCRLSQGLPPYQVAS